MTTVSTEALTFKLLYLFRMVLVSVQTQSSSPAFAPADPDAPPNPPAEAGGWSQRVDSIAGRVFGWRQHAAVYLRVCVPGSGGCMQVASTGATA